MHNLTQFPCDACGKCCRRVNLSEQTRFLDRGDGVCHHFNERTNLCRIYQNRPLVCRVKDYYLAHLSDQYSWEEFVRLNIEVCEILKKG
ncbi:YkgJ family cysteine cluster protein [Avibacterium avium]|uniref:YkgJ family cysteine cluster protein n=1 Tax=Avibacterium avium TaxID=751 RepID=UPI003BF7D947